jgi:hypothetical protein
MNDNMGNKRSLALGKVSEGLFKVGGNTSARLRPQKIASIF